MDWFKHMTASHEDPDIVEAFDKFGWQGLGVFWITLEVYGREFSRINGTGVLTLPIPYFCRKLRTSWTKVQLFLNFYQEKKRISYTFEDNNISLKIPKFIELASNWTSRVAATKHPLPTEVPTEAPTATRSRSRIRIKEIKKEKKVKLTDEEFMARLKETYSFLNFDLQMKKAQLWIDGHPGRKLTRKFLLYWFGKHDSEKPIETPRAPDTFVCYKCGKKKPINELRDKTGSNAICRQCYQGPLPDPNKNLEGIKSLTSIFKGGKNA